VIGFLQPGLGLGFGAEKELCFGLGSGFVGVLVPTLPAPPLPPSGGGVAGRGPELQPWWQREEIRKRILRDDEEIIELLMAMVLSGRLN
jgi:hypothetical protein